MKQEIALTCEHISEDAGPHDGCAEWVAPTDVPCSAKAEWFVMWVEQHPRCVEEEGIQSAQSCQAHLAGLLAELADNRPYLWRMP